MWFPVTFRKSYVIVLSLCRTEFQECFHNQLAPAFRGRAGPKFSSYADTNGPCVTWHRAFKDSGEEQGLTCIEPEGSLYKILPHLMRGRNLIEIFHYQ